MLRVRPFAAIQPHPGHAAQVASPPYDVVSDAEARSLAEANPLSFMRVIRPEVDLPASCDVHDDQVYAQGQINLAAMLKAGTLVHEREPRMYLYRQVLDHKSQIGLVCCCHVDDYNSEVIRKHEKTRQDKEDDRTRHLLTVNAHTGPVFLTYRDREDIHALVARDANRRPLFHFNAPDGVTHTVWPIDETDAYTKAFGQLTTAYVADGHHRSASAARAAKERASANPSHTGDEQYNWFLTVLFPASELSILAYNRVVLDLNGQDASAFLTAIAQVGRVQPADCPIPGQPGSYCFYIDGAWHELTIDPARIDHEDAVASLDVDLLQKHVLEPLLGIGDPRTDNRIGFVGGIRGPEELERRVDSGAAAIAFSLYPTSIDQLMNVADAGMIMPPKSTWFEPKLRSGLLVHSLEEVPRSSITA